MSECAPLSISMRWNQWKSRSHATFFFLLLIFFLNFHLHKFMWHLFILDCRFYVIYLIKVFYVIYLNKTREKWMSIGMWMWYTLYTLYKRWTNFDKCKLCSMVHAFGYIQHSIGHLQTYWCRRKMRLGCILNLIFYRLFCLSEGIWPSIRKLKKIK